jgi:cytochrome c-type biogenesis protein CcmH/NrfG
MGDCHLQLRNVKEAVRCYQEAARLEPDNPVCLTSLAHALEEKGEKEQAKLVRAKLESLQSALSREKK